MSSHLEVICGPMFSGKSEELIRRLNREQIARRAILVVKPEVDARTEHFIASRAIDERGESRTTRRFRAHVLRTSGQLWNLVTEDIQTLAIDEAQFCDENLPNIVARLLDERRGEEFAVMVAGLDMDFAHRPFGPMGALLAMADTVTKLSAICMQCYRHGARLTQRLKDVHDQVLIGDCREYQARCRNCYHLPEFR